MKTLLPQGSYRPSVFLILVMIAGFLAFEAASLALPIVNADKQMNTGSQQALSLMNYLTGRDYTWTIENGEGTLSADTGERVVYTAPDSNPNCTLNPTIRVTDSEGNCAEVRISVNCVLDSGMAYWEDLDYYITPYTDPFSKRLYYFRTTYDCQGNVIWTRRHSCVCSGGWCDTTEPLGLDYGCTNVEGHTMCGAIYCHDADKSCDTWGSWVYGCVGDARSEEQKENGCCPARLMPEYEPKIQVPLDIDLGRDPSENKQVCVPSLTRDPIRIYNGNNIESAVDLQLPSPSSRGFTFERFYNSRSELIGPQGYGWSHSYSASLVDQFEYHETTYLKIIDETGRGIYFTVDGDDQYLGAFKEPTRVVVEDGNYVWYRLEGSRYAFNTEGRLIWIEDVLRNRRNLTYDAGNRLETVMDEASSRVFGFHSNPDGFLDHISGPVTSAVSDGVWVRYGYDENDNLTSVTYADGTGFLYSYVDPNDPHNLTEKRDGMGHLLATWTYDDQDRAVENTARNGGRISIEYLNEHEVVITDAYGVNRTYKIWDTVGGRKRVTDIEAPPECPACRDGVVRLEYDNELRVIEAAYGNGLINQYDDFDIRGNAQTVILAFGTPGEKTISRTFHPEIDEVLSETESSVLGAGTKHTIWDHDDDGNDIPNENPTRLLGRKIDQGYTAGSSGNVIPYEYITTYTYNDKGQLTAIDGPRPGNGDTASFAYDPVTGDLLAVARPVIGTIFYSDYNAAGQVGRVTDPNGNGTTYSYDGRGRITAITNEADGTSTSYAYTAAGELGSVTAPNGVVYTFSYDTTYGRLTQVKDPLGNYIAYSYDEQGNRTEVSYFDETHTRHSWRRNSYQGETAPGKLWRVINPDDSFTEYTYNTGTKITSVTDPAGRTTTYTYDILKRLTIVTQPGDVITRYAYDSQDNLVSVTDAENHATSYTYDDTGRLISTTSPDTNTTSYTYDPAGNLATKTDANGTTVTCTYDALNRLTAIQPPDGEQVITFSYDEGTNGKGHLTGRSDQSGTYQYTYDAKGNLIKEEKIIDGVTFITAYTYDPAGILTGITYPSGRTITYGLDTAGRIAKVTTTKDGTTHTLAHNITTLPFGPITQLTYGSGTTLTRNFDELYRIASISSGSVQNVSYTREAAGNITGITDNLKTSKSQYFVYDDLYRLVGATGPYGNIAYAYDAVGNRLSKTTDGQTDTYTYEQGTNRLRSVEGATPKAFTYDPNGNTLSEDERAYAYNQHNRLTSILQNGSSLAEYVYNGEGQRVKKLTHDETRLFHYDLSGHLIAETDEEGDIVAEYAYLGDQPLAMIGEREVHNAQQEQGAASCFVSQASWAAPFQQGPSTEEAIYYFLTDHLGTPQRMTDNTGTVVWEAAYKPFGQAEADFSSSVTNNLRFPGQYFDEESGLHYNYFRYYLPGIGRYSRPDPSHSVQPRGSIIPYLTPYLLNTPQELSLFAYVTGNPLKCVDPDGLNIGIPPFDDPIPGHAYIECLRRVEARYLPQLLKARDDYEKCLNTCDSIRQLGCEAGSTMKTITLGGCKLACFFEYSVEYHMLGFKMSVRSLVCWALYQQEEKEAVYRKTEP
jgi:RHS repeat-associated protein